jgi:hypothetical protein
MAQLTADDLVAGSAQTFTVPIPAALLQPGSSDGAVAGDVVIRPLTVRDIERISRAAKEQRLLSSVLMVHQALVAPKLSVDQVGALPAGAVQFLLRKINEVSGLALGAEEVEQAIRAPLTRACFVLAKEFGWTPAQCSELTVGQVLLYLEMLARDGQVEAP